MQPGAVVPGDVLDHGSPGLARVGQVSMSSPLSEEKNDSVSALSQHWPVRPWRL